MEVSIIPRPLHEERKSGYFTLDAQTKIHCAQDSQSKFVAAELIRIITSLGGPATASGSFGTIGNAVHLDLVDNDPTLPPEAYRLVIATGGIVITATTGAGLYYGVQSLGQLLILNGTTCKIPCAQIHDAPRFPWRGFMLDVARHFFTVDQIKRFLDLMALHKLNRFHWHLVDDQGWRIEIKKHPRLTEIGAWRAGVGFGLDPDSTTLYDDTRGYGGFYTQDDIRDIVSYAAQRHIAIVPEIELPGHSGAALAAYPNLSCSKLPRAVPCDGSVMKNIYCAGNDDAFQFLQEVLAEVIDLFPGQYIHIGGDEVPKDPWRACPQCQARMQNEHLDNEDRLQSYFISRIERFIATRGRKIIGWDEILEGGLTRGAAVMSWRGMKGGIAAAKAHHDVVMSPTDFAYFDYYQSRATDQPKAIGGYLPLQTVYSFEPIPIELSDEDARYILGPQANLWTEYVANMPHAEYMTYPRLSAMAEVAWTSKDRRDWNDFQKRLPNMLVQLGKMNVNHYHEE